jgi:hypothetical protein
MSVELLEPDTHVVIKYPARTRKRRIEFDVEANDPVTAYVIDKDGLDQFYAGKDMDVFYGLRRRRKHNDEVMIPPNTPWYLVIVNEDDRPVAVSYDVSG